MGKYLNSRHYFTYFFILCFLTSNAQTTSKQNPKLIAVPFTLTKAGYVTLVIEDKDSKRVRNLVSDTWFNVGQNVSWWDGMDDLGRDAEAASHGIYKIPAKSVIPGLYKIRGIVHSEIKTTYEFSVYTSGIPPWNTADHTGGWLANHTPPQAALFVPAEQSPIGESAVYLGCYVTEGTDGLVWVDLNGKKMGGKQQIGGIWTAAPYLARDAGNKIDKNVYAYVASVWETGKRSGLGELRVTALTSKKDKQIVKYDLGPLESDNNIQAQIGGLAVHDGIGVVSLSRKNQLFFFDAKSGKIIGTLHVDQPNGLAFDNAGRLLVLSGNKLLRYKTIENIVQASYQAIISSRLDAPVGITLDTQGRIYISNGGESHQVKVFNDDGKFLQSIGNPGPPKAGVYDSLHMNNPTGITIDSKQHLWVTEKDFLPKRVSVWSLDGKLIHAFYGPAKYGGGGTLDASNKTQFYYAEQAKGTMEFKLDWIKGESTLTRILYRKEPGNLELPKQSASPEMPLYYKGKRYFTNCYNSSPTNGSPTAFLFVERKGVVYPAAAMGRADLWDVLKQNQFKSMLPDGVDLNSKSKKNFAFFIWTDLNEDAQVQKEEITFKAGKSGGVTIMPDLSFCIAQLDDKTVQFSPTRFSNTGIPVYQMNSYKILATGVIPRFQSGGDQALTDSSGWTVVTLGIKPFEKYSISGTKNGKTIWSYPNMWPGLHPSHQAPIPDFPGELIGPTRLTSGLMENKGSNAGPLWTINSNHGMIYIFTRDGLFVTTLFEPMRIGTPWKMPMTKRGMDLKGFSLGEENFWPNITQTTDGQVYLMDGGHSSLLRIDGLKSVTNLPDNSLTITQQDLDNSWAFQLKKESERQRGQSKETLSIPLLSTHVKIDAKWDDWTKANWINIDKRGVKANFNSHSKPYNVTGAIVLSDKRLCVGFRTEDPLLLRNSGEIALAPFKTGGALDIMISATNTVHDTPEAGDMRILITLIKKKPYGLLYKALVPGTKISDKVPFSSPWRTVMFDSVIDISSQMEFASDKDGNYQISVPLSVLNLKPIIGMTIRGDLGILRGDGINTLSRTYWNNKSTSTVSDVPSEAELTPNLWGTWKFISP